MKVPEVTGVTGTKLRKALKDLEEEAEQGNFWLWIKERTRLGDSKMGAVGRLLAPPSRDVLGLKEQNISEEWLPANEPTASTVAPSVVHQAEIPGR